MKTYIFRNKRNENKYIEVKVYKDGHIYVKQFMKWYTTRGIVKNYLASRSNKGRAYRYNKNSLSELLEDYTYLNEVA